MADLDKLEVRLVTPDRELVDTTADAVELPGRSGYLEVLYGAAPLLTELGTGMVTIHGAEGGEQRYYVAWGFAEVLPNRVTILAESAEEPQAIDAAAAEAEQQRGQKMWEEAGEDPHQYERANQMMRDAEARLNAKNGA
jgi:F-type H+-transporting ATPase subunit epsilon